MPAAACFPFNGMLAADAYLWTKYRDRDQLMEKFKQLTENLLTGGVVNMEKSATAPSSRIRIIKDVWIGSDALYQRRQQTKT